MYRALVVDDVEAIRCSIAGQVDDSAAPVIAAGIAENGSKALEWLDDYYADICITDIRMPLIDGLELIRIIRERYPWIASLVISSYDDFSYARTSIQLEAIDYILKPVDEKNLDEALGMAVRKIEGSRFSKAASIMLSNITECNTLVGKWVEYLKVLTSDHNGIIDETVQRLCVMAEGDYYLVDFLADELLSRVAQEMKLQKPDIITKLHDKREHSAGPVKKTDMKGYFVSGCIEKLAYAADIAEKEFKESKDSQQSRIMGNIIKYLNENYTRSDLTLQELSDFTLYSKNHIANIFKQETGLTIWNYIIDLRMKKAREMLNESSAKALEVAMSVGYNNYNHFSQLFKEYYGISAQEYRKKVCGK